MLPPIHTSPNNPKKEMGVPTVYVKFRSQQIQTKEIYNLFKLKLLSVFKNVDTTRLDRRRMIILGET